MMQALTELEQFIDSFDKKSGLSFKTFIDGHNLQLDTELLAFNTRLDTESPGDCDLPLTKKLMQERAEYYSKLCKLIEKGFNL
jgi:hypothetical protein